MIDLTTRRPAILYTVVVRAVWGVWRQRGVDNRLAQAVTDRSRLLLGGIGGDRILRAACCDPLPAQIGDVLVGTLRTVMMGPASSNHPTGKDAERERYDRFSRKVLVVSKAITKAHVWVVWLLLAALVGFLVVNQVLYVLDRRQAFDAFVQSRGPNPPPIDSDAFATRGIRCGFTESQVDEKMIGATEKMGRMYRPGDHGFRKYYHFVYQPVHVVPLFRSEQELIVEYYWVIFDASGRAVRLERRLFIADDSRTGRTTIDLCDQSNPKAERAAETPRKGKEQEQPGKERKRGHVTGKEAEAIAINEMVRRTGLQARQLEADSELKGNEWTVLVRQLPPTPGKFWFVYVRRDGTIRDVVGGE